MTTVLKVGSLSQLLGYYCFRSGHDQFLDLQMIARTKMMLQLILNYPNYLDLCPQLSEKKEKHDHVIATLIEILKSAIHSLKRRIPLDSSYVVKEYVCISQNLQFPLNPVNERSKSIRSRKKVWLRAAVWKITHLKCDNIFCLLWIQLIVHLALFCHTTTVAAVRLF